MIAHNYKSTTADKSTISIATLCLSLCLHVCLSNCLSSNRIRDKQALSSYPRCNWTIVSSDSIEVGGNTELGGGFTNSVVFWSRKVSLHGPHAIHWLTTFILSLTSISPIRSDFDDKQKSNLSLRCQGQSYSGWTMDNEHLGQVACRHAYVIATLYIRQWAN